MVVEGHLDGKLRTSIVESAWTPRHAHLEGRASSALKLKDGGIAARQAVDKARSEVRTAEGAVEALAAVCDSLRGDEADLRDRLASLHTTVASATEEAAEAVTARDAACQVIIICSSQRIILIFISFSDDSWCAIAIGHHCSQVKV